MNFRPPYSLQLFWENILVSCQHCCVAFRNTYVLSLFYFEIEGCHPSEGAGYRTHTHTQHTHTWSTQRTYTAGGNFIPFRNSKKSQEFDRKILTW